VRAHFNRALSDIAALRTTVIDWHVTTDGLMAGIIARLNLHITHRDGRESRLSVRHRDALRRVDGRWYAMIEMRSFPTDLAAGKPVTWIGN
jgi:ketosteroid isomerase-like protein